MTAAPSPPAGHNPRWSAAGSVPPWPLSEDSAPHVATWAWAPNHAQRPIQHEKSVLLSLVCLQQTIELDFKL